MTDKKQNTEDEAMSTEGKKKKAPSKKAKKPAKPAKKVTKKKKVALIGGRYRPNSAMAKLFNLLAAGKAIAVKAVEKQVKGVNVKARIRTMGRHGRNDKTWVLTVADGKATLKLKKGKK